MIPSRSWCAGLLLVLAACTNESTTLERVDSVRLTPVDPTIDVGLTIQFTAEGLDAQGNVVPGVDFTWGSSNGEVATVNDNGLATARSVGTTAITASAGSAPPASQALTVQPSRCDAPVEVLLDPGQFQSYDATTCLRLPSGASGDRYRIAVTRPTVIGDPLDTTSVWLEINPIVSAEQVAGAETAGPAPVAPATYTTRPATFGAGDRIDGTRFLRDKRIMDRTRRFHLELRRRELDLGLRSGPLAQPPARVEGPALADPPTTDRLYLLLDCNAPSPTRTPVRLIDFNDDVALYQDSASYAASPLDAADHAAPMLSYYSDYVADFARAFWGATPDIDGNGRLTVTTAPVLADSVAAAVYSGDFLTTADCASSNEGEVIYFSEDVIRNLAPPNPDDQSYLALGVLAHEQKHVVSLYNGVSRNTSPRFHATWIEEGTAEVAQTKSSRVAWAAVGGPALGTVITGDDIIQWNNSNGEIGPEAWGVVVQLADLVAWGATQPNSLLTNPAGADDFHTFYAGGWHWHRFLGDAFGDASTALADSSLFREMTDSLTPGGTGSLATVTGRTFDELFEDVTVAASFHDAGPTPTRAFTTWDLTTAAAIFSNPPELSPPHRYPWPVTTDLDGNVSRGFTRGIYSCPPQLVNEAYELADESDRCPMGPAGTRFHDFVSDGTGQGAQVQVFGASNGRLVVTRIN